MKMQLSSRPEKAVLLKFGSFDDDLGILLAENYLSCDEIVVPVGFLKEIVYFCLRVLTIKTELFK
jgi:hypothetical protein